MSLTTFPHTFFPRSMFDMSQWLKPYDFGGVSTMDMFDPFDELDTTLAKNFQWLKRPEFLQTVPTLPKYPQKYRIMIDCAGYDPKSLKTEFTGRKLFVSGREDHKAGPEDYSTKEFKKAYELPVNAEPEKLVSFMTPYGHLVVEIPLKETQTQLNAELFPKIIDVNGGKAVSLKITIPENIDPSKVHVSVKDRDLIVKAEDRVEKPDGFTKFYYYKRSTLPENTDFNALKCHVEQGKIAIQAPLKVDYKSFRNIPIDYGYGYGYGRGGLHQQSPGQYQQSPGQQQSYGSKMNY